MARGQIAVEGVEEEESRGRRKNHSEQVRCGAGKERIAVDEVVLPCSFVDGGGRITGSEGGVVRPLAHAEEVSRGWLGCRVEMVN